MSTNHRPLPSIPRSPYIVEEAMREIGANNDVITTAEIHNQIEDCNQLMPKVIFNEISTQSCPLLKVTLVIMYKN